MSSETSDYESNSEKSAKVSTTTSNLQIKNYLFDNKNLKTLDVNTDLRDGLKLDSDEEVFLVTCPKSFNPSKMKGQDLGDLRDVSEKVDFGFSVDHFKKLTPFTVFVPKTGAPDTLQLIKPVGKISIFKKFTVPKIEASVPEEVTSPTSKKHKRKKRPISESSDIQEVVVKEEPKTPIKSPKKKRILQRSPSPTAIEIKKENEFETPKKKSKKPPAELSWLVDM